MVSASKHKWLRLHCNSIGSGNGGSGGGGGGILGWLVAVMPVWPFVQPWLPHTLPVWHQPAQHVPQHPVAVQLAPGLCVQPLCVVTVCMRHK